MANTVTLEIKPLDTIVPVLYDIPPIGAGTLFVESMQHYIGRVAEAHCVSPYYLFRYLGSTYQEVSSKLNGPSEQTRKLVRLLCDLSPRDDIQLTSLGRWHNVLSSKHCIEWRPRHCPICSTEGSNYPRLLWSIKAVTACTIHRVSLIPIGENVIERPSKEELSWQLYVHSQLNDLLTYDEFPTITREEFSTLFSRLLETVSISHRPPSGVPDSYTGNIFYIANTWKYAPKSVITPTLLTSLMLTARLDIPLVKLLTGEI